MLSEVAEVALFATRLGQFQQLLKTGMILILNFTVFCVTIFLAFRVCSQKGGNKKDILKILHRRMKTLRMSQCKRTYRY